MYLEAVRRPARRFDEWDLQLLAVATQLAALLLEAERAHGPRAAAPPLVHDGAAPLIGSTAAMRTLRQTVERVAVTDFTILIEGGTGPEAHPDLGVRVCSSGQYEGGEVAGAQGAASFHGRDAVRRAHSAEPASRTRTPH